MSLCGFFGVVFLRWEENDFTVHRQGTVFALLVLNYLFPYTQYPVTKSSPDELKSTIFATKTTFMPIWKIMRLGLCGVV